MANPTLGQFGASSALRLLSAFSVPGTNLFDKTKANIGYYVNDSTGQLAANAAYFATDYMAVIPGQQYRCNTGFSGRYAFYNVSKQYVSGAYVPPSYSGGVYYNYTFIVPEGCYFVRVSNSALSTLNTFQVEKGANATAYQPYAPVLSIPDFSTFKTETATIVLPSELCVAVGETIELYNSQVVKCGNINDFHIQWTCSIGKNMKRKFSVTGTAPLIGEYPLSITVYDNSLNVLSSLSSTIKIVTNVIANPKTILTIGDSLSNNKAWLQELRTLSDDQFTLVGTRGSGSLKHEGRSGFSAASYLAATEYTLESEGVHPFWDATNNRFNWSYYKTNSSINPNAVMIILGSNGLSIDATTNAGNIKQIVDYIRQDDATIPIFVAYTLFKGDQNGIGGTATPSSAWKLQEDAKVFNLMIKLKALLDNVSYTNLKFIPIATCHDSEYNFGATATAVNPRASQTEALPVEGTHPQEQGYLQMADIIFGSLAKYLNS